MDIQQIIGKNVVHYRRLKKLSQEEVAARIGLDQAYVSRLESGQLNITVGTLALLAEALTVAPKLLLEER